jgi:hypothetical protein
VTALSLVMTLAMDVKELSKKLERIHTSSMIVMTLVYDSEKSNIYIDIDGQLETYLQQISKSKAGYFELVGIDCSALDAQAQAGFVYCTDQYRSHLPILVILIIIKTLNDPPLNFVDPDTKEKREIKQVAFQGKLEEKALFDAAV